MLQQLIFIAAIVNANVTTSDSAITVVVVAIFRQGREIRIFNDSRRSKLG
jgi:hypothetical protein